MGRGRHCQLRCTTLEHWAGWWGRQKTQLDILLLCWLQHPAGIEWRDLHYPVVLNMVTWLTSFQKSCWWKLYLSRVSLLVCGGGRPGFNAFFCLRRCISHLTEVSLTTNFSELTSFWTSFILKIKKEKKKRKIHCLRDTDKGGMPGSQSSTQWTQGEVSTAELPNQSNKNWNIKALSTLAFWFGAAMQYWDKSLDCP